MRKIYTPLNNATLSTSKASTKSKGETKVENTLQLIKTFVGEAKNGIAQKDLATLICRQAENGLEIVGKNTLWKLLDKYDGVFYKAEKMQRKNGYGITKMYLPLLDSHSDTNKAMMAS